MLPTYRTDRIVLRPLALEDAPALQAFASDFEVTRMLAQVPHPYPDGEAESFIGEMIAESDDVPMRVFAIEIAGAFAGTIGTTSTTGFRADPAGFGYWLGRPYWGRGLMSEAAACMLARDVFGTLGLSEVRSGMYTDNLASWRIQEKLGFERIGQSMKDCLARGHPAPHWETRLTRARFEEVTA